MNTVDITLNVDESILVSMKEKKNEFKEILLFYTALSLYKKGKLSLGKAACLANYNRLDFIRKMQEEGEPVFDYDVDLVDEMIGSAERI